MTGCDLIPGRDEDVILFPAVTRLRLRLRLRLGILCLLTARERGYVCAWAYANFHVHMHVCMHVRMHKSQCIFPF